jgi:Asp-tRNA(Asn)/Glu-tRNA(Gln) amidotransferase A subunit family amidase
MFRELSISDIHSKLLARELEPYDVVNEAIIKYDKYDSLYKCWVNFNKDALIETALNVKTLINKGQELRSLECMPIALKDIINTIDFPTQMGSPIWKNFTPGNDARVVYNLKNNGGVIAGKTVTAEFAVHALNETLNPHNIDLTPGTSSSGSAVAVALGMVPFSVGTQTAGSIIRPASFCGVYGIKPSFGLIPRTGILKTTDSLDSVGFFVSNIKNIRPVFDALRVHGPNYPFSHQAIKNLERQKKINNKPWKIAFIKTHTWSFADDYAKDSLASFLKDMSSAGNFEINYVNLPAGLEESHNVHATIYNKTLSYYFKEDFNNKELVSEVMASLIESGFSINVESYYNALGMQEDLIKKMDDFFLEYDILISLSTAGQAPLRHVSESPDPSLIWTLCHLPAINIPMFTSPNGIPFGIQVVARKYNDLLLFDFLDHLSSVGIIPKSSNPKLNS